MNGTFTMRSTCYYQVVGLGLAEGVPALATQKTSHR